VGAPDAALALRVYVHVSFVGMKVKPVARLPPNRIAWFLTGSYPIAPSRRAGGLGAGVLLVQRFSKKL